jgi:hypothetical protein
VTLRLLGWEEFPTPGLSPTLGSLGPSHQRHHESRVSLQGPHCALDVLGIPHEELRDRGGHVFVCFFMFLVFWTRFERYMMMFWCIFFMRILMFDFGSFKLLCLLMEYLCMAPLTLVVMFMRKLVFHPFFFVSY